MLRKSHQLIEDHVITIQLHLTIKKKMTLFMQHFLKMEQTVSRPTMNSGVIGELEKANSESAACLFTIIVIQIIMENIF